MNRKLFSLPAFFLLFTFSFQQIASAGPLAYSVQEKRSQTNPGTESLGNAGEDELREAVVEGDVEVVEEICPTQDQRASVALGKEGRNGEDVIRDSKGDFSPMGLDAFTRLDPEHSFPGKFSQVDSQNLGH